MLHAALIIAAGALLAAAPSTTGSHQAPETPAKPAAQAKAETRYCMTYDNVVGSRVTKSECRTKAEWKREGIDIDRELKRA